VTGEEYQLPSDQHCPLTSVGVIFNEHNVWANIQEEDAPSKISYDLTQRTVNV
jgi:coiled-coil and C2 domain-containing protein 2A